jgi:hypothetical protein
MKKPLTKENKEKVFHYKLNEKESGMIEILLSMGIAGGETNKLKDKQGKEFFLSELCFPLKRKFVEQFNEQLKK